MPRAWDRLPPEGHPELRLWFARDVGGNARAEDVVLAPGGQAALAATFRTLVPFGGPILLESPSYFGALSVARSLGLKPVPVPLDAEGIRVDLLEAAFASSGARALYLQPAFSNPSGVTLSEQRRKGRAALGGARRCVRDRRTTTLAIWPSAPLRPRRSSVKAAIASSTFARSPNRPRPDSVSLASSLEARCSAACAACARRKTSSSLASCRTPRSNSSTPRVGGNYVQRLRQTLRERRDVAIRALGRHLPKARLTRIPEGGFSLWVELPAGVDDLAFVAAGRERGRLAHSGRALVCGGAPGRVRPHQHGGRECERPRGGDRAAGRAAGLVVVSHSPWLSRCELRFSKTVNLRRQRSPRKLYCANTVQFMRSEHRRTKRRSSQRRRPE